MIFFGRMDSDSKPVETAPQEENKQQRKKNYRKDKPWDNDQIDHWKIEVFVLILYNVYLTM